MQKRSLPGVRVYSLDRAALIERLRAAAQQLAATHPDVEEVRLFGSLARGNQAPGSDADIVVVVSQADAPFSERAAYALTNCGIGVDMLVYTRAELDGLMAENSRFSRTLEEESVYLYRKLELDLRAAE